MEQRGKFIAIEGPDGSGKTVQQKLLIDKLQENGRNVKTVDFPQYETSLFGREVGKMLSGEYGSLENIHPAVASVLYAADRWKASSRIGTALRKGSDVIANRYTLSNMAHQSARLPEVERDEFVHYLNALEYSNEGFGIPKPDIYIYLRVPQEVTRELVLKKAERAYLNGESKDLLENDVNHQLEAAKMYDYLAKNVEGIVTIDCFVDGELLSPEAISGLVWGDVRMFLDREVFHEGRIRKERE
jgi:dTMP kinase